MSKKTEQSAPKAPRFTCSACGLGVVVLGEHKVFGCTCGAPVSASCSVTLAGRGGVATK